MEYHELAIKRIGSDALMIFYHAPDGINSGLDDEFGLIAVRAGYKRYASGYDHVEKVRDIAFKKVQ